MGKSKNKYYAYFFESSSESGVLSSWAECSKKVKGTAARYKGFVLKSEAEKWIAGGAEYDKSGDGKKKKKDYSNFVLKKGVYFDAGTGRGNGVEFKITDEKGKSLLSKIVRADKITEFDTYFLGKKFTNNFGELSGLFFALKYCLNSSGERLILGDSKLVLDYWSHGHFKRDKLPVATVDLIEKVVVLRREFEKVGGKLEFVSGDVNPSDLGFHK